MTRNKKNKRKLKIQLYLDPGEWSENQCQQISCPLCHSYQLFPLHRNIPSLDMICLTRSCQGNFEVKSKWLHDGKLPSKLKINLGSWSFFENMVLNSFLHLFIVIYTGRLKRSETWTVKNIYFVNNQELLLAIKGENKNIQVVSKKKLLITDLSDNIYA